jgi:hypothetical protein
VARDARGANVDIELAGPNDSTFLIVRSARFEKTTPRELIFRAT